MKRKNIAILIVLIVIVVSFVVWQLTMPVYFNGHGPSPEVFCAAQGMETCNVARELPPTWSQTVNFTVNIRVSCQELLDCSSCEECGF
ncbi:MAG: hypothetical protein JSW41_02470 [Candidatus Aenigmatarchaeota archaeon]|nr:MAG: hypothetical protein JSW41_02470 [Candidatus Aenigmarchaeota archaeon]